MIVHTYITLVNKVLVAVTNPVLHSNPYPLTDGSYCKVVGKVHLSANAQMYLVSQLRLVLTYLRYGTVQCDSTVQYSTVPITAKKPLPPKCMP